MTTEETQLKLYKVFEEFNSNNKSIIEPMNVVGLVDEICSVINEQSTLAKVGEFMKAFKQPILQIPQIPDKATVHLRLSLILEELSEIAEACGSEIYSEFGTTLKAKAEEIRDFVENKRETLQPDIIKVNDGFIDLEYVTKGGIHSFGLGSIFNNSFEEVHSSNMSKLCFTGEEAAKTKQHYTEQGINVEIVPHENYFLILRTRDQKVLKSINYKPANLKPIVDGISNKTTVNE